jgi:hypothetical protein
MKCPYCGHDAIKTGTGNNTSPQYEGLGVIDDDDGYDFDISMFTCTVTPKHRFYCDDLNGNSQDEFAEFDDDEDDEN